MRDYPESNITPINKSKYRNSAFIAVQYRVFNDKNLPYSKNECDTAPSLQLSEYSLLLSINATSGHLCHFGV